jgi:DNA replication and repair protein RecF
MAAARVALSALSLKDFRSHASLSAAFSAPLVVLTGPNGAGKTNIIEAISLLTPGRGLRRAPFNEITRTGTSEGWAVAADVLHDDGTARLGTGISGAAPGEAQGRRVRINGAAASSAEAFLDYLRVLWLTPAMDGLFAGPAGDRRRFLDRLVLTIDPGHARRTRDLDRLLTQRNRLLEENASSAWLDAVEAELAANAVAVALARAETVALISARSAAQAGEQPDFPAGRIALAGDFDREIVGRKAIEAETWHRRTLSQGRSADRAAGRTLAGPHRSDLEVTFLAKDMAAALSSTGEQKALLIGLVLAHAALVAETSGLPPVLLLDEIVAHLDPGRRAAFFRRLAALGCQAFLTGTDAALFAALDHDAEFFRVGPSRLDPHSPAA